MSLSVIAHGLCPTCERHVKIGAESCPFCGGPLHDSKSVTLKTPDDALPAPVYGAPPGPFPVAPTRGRRVSAKGLAALMVGAMLLGFLIARAVLG